MTDTKKRKRKLKPGRRPTHGGYVFLRSGLISKDNKHIEQYLSAMRSGYIKELGPTEDDLSTGQTVLLNQLVTCIGFTRLVEENAKRTEDIKYLYIRQYMSFMKHGRQLVLDLGLNPVNPEPMKYLDEL
ncbi:unnamed protein product [marine sediment metagenome]|uniref:Uncharacterized protein n=1 Tax=marine sediment metagenome TaxID=412755 RepID=X1A7H3_9ZZZZ